MRYAEKSALQPEEAVTDTPVPFRPCRSGIIPPMPVSVPLRHRRKKHVKQGQTTDQPSHGEARMADPFCFMRSEAIDIRRAHSTLQTVERSSSSMRRKAVSLLAYLRTRKRRRRRSLLSSIRQTGEVGACGGTIAVERSSLYTFGDEATFTRWKVTQCPGAAPDFIYL